MALLTVKQAAERLGLKSRNSIYRKIRTRELPTITAPDGTPRIRAEGLEELWRSITRTRCDSPAPKAVDPLAAAREERRGKPLRPASERMKPQGVLDEAPLGIPVRTRDEEPPDYNESRARSEYERANLLELERRQKEGLLLERKVVERTWASLVTAAKVKLLGIPSRAKQRIPHLTLEEIDLLTELVRESLEDLADSGGDEEMEQEEE